MLSKYEKTNPLNQKVGFKNYIFEDNNYLTNLKLKEDGFDSTFEFENRMNELLRKKAEK